MRTLALFQTGSYQQNLYKKISKVKNQDVKTISISCRIYPVVSSDPY